MPVHRRRHVAAALTFAVLAAGCADGTTDATASPATDDTDEIVALVHRTATCGCCGGYEDFLTSRGFQVVQEMHDDLAPVKERLGVPVGEQSCHTSEIGGYVVEGHVPLRAILRLLDERPDIDGIALAGMPVGSPGMDGEQTEPLVVTTLVDGEVTGEFGTF